MPVSPWHQLHAPAQAPQEASPSIARLPWAKSRFLHPEVFPFFPGIGAPQLQDRGAPSPFPGPSSSSSSARPGLGWRCAAGTETAALSLHLVTSRGFGLKSSHRRTFILWQSLSPSDLGESHQPPTPPLVCPSSFSAHLPGEAQAAAPWHLSKPAWPQIHRSQCQNNSHCSPASKEEQEKSSVRKQILNRVQPAPLLCLFSLQPGGR